MKEGLIYIGWRRYKLYDHVRVIQCFKCGRFNHLSKQCKSKKVCLKCSGDHSENECVFVDLSCTNCVKSVEKFLLNLEVNHDARDGKCPSYLKIVDTLKSRVSYELKG